MLLFFAHKIYDDIHGLNHSFDSIGKFISYRLLLLNILNSIVNETNAFDGALLNGRNGPLPNWCLHFELHRYNEHWASKVNTQIRIKFVLDCCEMAIDCDGFSLSLAHCACHSTERKLIGFGGFNATTSGCWNRTTDGGDLIVFVQSHCLMQI